MARETDSIPNCRFNLYFLFPQIYRPLKTNFARRFELLSHTCTGYIFTLCTVRYRDLAIANFRIRSENISRGTVGRLLKALWVQTVFPLLRLWGRSRVDAVIAYDPYASGFAGMILKALFRTRLIIEVNGDYHKLEPSQRVLKKWLMRLICHLSISCSNAIRVLNRDQEQYFNRYYPRKRVYRFPDFVASEYFQSLECYQGDYVLSVGHPFELKGMDVVVRAFKLISERHPAIRLKIMGHSPEKELIEYKRLAAGNARIEFVKPGWIEDVGEQIRGCYVLVNAARYEAMGRVHLEAMACRKPVVASRTNGGVECVEDGRTGLLCEIDDVEDLARQLDRLLSNPGLAAQMGQAGFDHLQRQFSQERYTSSFLAMVDEVVKSRDRQQARITQMSAAEKITKRDGEGIQPSDI